MFVAKDTFTDVYKVDKAQLVRYVRQAFTFNQCPPFRPCSGRIIFF